MDNTQLFRLIGTISRQATSEVNRSASVYGLDNNLFLYLIRIVEQDGISQVALANQIKVDKTTLSRALTKLTTAQLIVKRTNPKNKKFKQLYATAKGQTYYNKVYQMEQDYIEAVLKPLQPNEKAMLGQLLTKISPSE
ncbi:MarR family winged helix-turn-helix transcriptional regulator [Agrilactobacillus yilanensis]|uniref:MarR family winged helix-turn-helix transcriptional regulator n=1 Tax=Agrilactobacillus yilanensis TaxID=2485997 RepID=A0ABW4J5P7_9LACO|nr:MarR family transcriptional regulator [Agrilactobacillus yilanensis]